MLYRNHALVHPALWHGIALEIMAAIVSKAAEQEVSFVGVQLGRRQLSYIEIVLQLAKYMFYGLPPVIEAEHHGSAVTAER